MDISRAMRLWKQLWEYTGPPAVVVGLVVVVGAAVPICADLVPDLHRGAIERDQSWSGLHRISGELVVRNAELHIQCGAHVRMAPGASVEVADGGRIRSSGRPGCPVTWTSSASEPEDGDWDGIEIERGGRLRARHTTFEFGGSDGSVLRTEAGGRAALVSVAVKRAAHGAVELQPGSELERADELEFADVRGKPLRLPVDQLDVLGTLGFADTLRSIVVFGGVVEAPATWNVSGTELQMVGDVAIRARTTVRGETSVRLFPDSRVTVESGGVLRAVGDDELGWDAPHRWVRFELDAESELRFESDAASGNLFRRAVVRGAGALVVEESSLVRIRDSRLFGSECSRHSARSRVLSRARSCT